MRKHQPVYEQSRPNMYAEMAQLTIAAVEKKVPRAIGSQLSP